MDRFSELVVEIDKFSNSRKFSNDTPKNLVMALSVEAAELMEPFTWLNNGSLDELDEVKLKHIQEELGDVLIYLIALATQLNTDLIQCALDKMEMNKLKYPSIKA